MRSEFILGCRRLLVTLIGVVLCLSFGCSDSQKPMKAQAPAPGSSVKADAANAPQGETRIDNKDVGKDPHKFQTAKTMYEVGSTMARDAKMDGLLRQIARQLEANPDPVSTELRNLMISLEPYRKCEVVQVEIRRWAGRCAEWVRERSLVAGVRTESADDHYRKGEFARAVDEYTRILRQSPTFNDARNNLALAEMHQRHDLVAQFQLEVLRQLKPDYLPAIINLTVIYERLGQSAQAKALAMEAAAKRSDVPAATFNLAWWQFTEGETQKAEQTLHPLVDLQIDPLYAEFYRLLQAKLGMPARTGP